MSDVVNLLDFDAHGLLAYCESLGEKSFRAKQLQRWIHQSGASDFGEMTDLAKSLREKLATRANIQAPAVITDHLSSDGTRKWLVDVGQGNAVGTVYIPEETRGTLCVSSQAGCAVNCRFCSTGKQGFSRNLSTGEIIGQLWMAEFAMRKQLGRGPKDDRVITNVVMMGNSRQTTDRKVLSNIRSSTICVIFISSCGYFGNISKCFIGGCSFPLNRSLFTWTYDQISHLKLTSCVIIIF